MNPGACLRHKLGHDDHHQVMPIAHVKFVMKVWTNKEYGIFGDELVVLVGAYT